MWTNNKCPKNEIVMHWRKDRKSDNRRQQRRQKERNINNWE